MSLSAEDLIGVPIAFALAQKPYLLDGGEHIATLAPIMNLDPGELISHSPLNFPSNGYVFWWSVPSGTWQPGDIVVGTIERSRKYQVPDQDWYQVHSSRGTAVRNEVYDSISVAGSHPDGYRWLIDGRHRLAGATAPVGEFYVWTNAELIGPFHAADQKNENGRVSYICTPSDMTGGVVMRYPHLASGGVSEQSRRSHSVTISMNDSSPGRHTSVDRIRQYCLIRRADLDRWQSAASPLTLLPDDLIVSRACKRITGRSKKREAREQIESLLSEIKAEDSANENAVQDGLIEMLAKVKASESVTNRIVEAIVQSGEFESRIETAVEDQIKLRVRTRVGEIEEQAKKAASAKIAEFSGIEKKITALKKQKEQLENGLKKLEEKRVEDQLRAEGLLASVNQRLQSGREELLGELALLGPLFQGNGMVHAAGNGHLTPPDANSNQSNRQSQLAFNPSEPPTPKSPALSERRFMAERLWPCLAKHGCALSSRDAEFFHVAMLGSRILGLPHPGWAAGYAEAMSGTATISTVSASPNWLDFDTAFDRGLSNAWRHAVGDPSRLHLIVIDGIDRCPSHAWLRPWLNILAGWSPCLPNTEQFSWPNNVRLCVTEERSQACFDLPDELRQWILFFNPRTSDETPPGISDGHMPLESWRLASSRHSEETFDGFTKALELPVGKPYSRSRADLAARLRDALIRLDPEESSRAENIISKRLFECWLQDATE
jgi:hypothetical protein